MTATVRVHVVDRRQLVRRGLAACLASAPGLAVVAEAATAEEGYRLAEELAPDVLVVGTTLPDAPGLAGPQAFRRRFPLIPLVVLTAAESDDELFAAIRVGASAYCGLDVEEPRLVDLVGRAAAGEYVVNEQLLENPPVAARVLEQFRSGVAADPEAAAPPLTARELEILRRVGDGLTNAQIGSALGISDQTVKNHVTAVLRKLGVHDRTQAVVTALRRGWITLDDSPLPDHDTARRARTDERQR